VVNVGWRAAAGDWIQFIEGQDLLASNKIEVQANLIPQLPEDARVICSSWQRIGSSGKPWQVTGPVNPPSSVEPSVLELVTPRAAPVGAALFRKKSIQAAAGFSEEKTFTVGEHFMLKMAGIGEGARPSRPSGSVAFVEAPSSSPLFFERVGPRADPRHWNVGFAREHLENVLIARAMLRENQHGMLTPENIQEIAILCDESLRDLREYDRAAFKQCSQWLREIDPSLLMRETVRLRSHIPGTAQLVAATRHWVTSGSAAFADAMSRGTLSLKKRLRRVWGMPSDRLRAVAEGGRRQIAALGLTKRAEGVLATGALIVVAATALLGPADLFGTQGSPSSLVGQPQSVQKLSGGDPIINVASTIYAEPLSSWPMPMEIGPSQRISPDSILHVRGLPSAVTLSEGRRVSADVWAVPLVALTNLELRVATGASGRSDLALMLVGTDGSMLAEARTAISINEPSGMTTREATTADLSLGKPVQSAKESGPRSEVTGRRLEPTAPTTKPEPSHARTDPTATELLALLPMTKPSNAQAAPPPVPERDAASSIIPKPPMVMAPTELKAAPIAASAAAPSWPATIANDDQGVASKASAERAQREATTVPIAKPEPSHATTTSTPAERTLAATEPLPQEERQRAEKMIARGERDLADGNVSMARQFFLRAAEAGVARGALLLASTYDPNEYVRLRIQGVQPNSAEARKWYKRARELGAMLADEQLLRLGAAE
jgi:hypothetical protein